MRNKKQYLRDYQQNGVANCLPEATGEVSVDTTSSVFHGRVKMFDDVRGFGFIIYDDHDGTRQEVFFHVSDVIEGEPVRRARVTFELKSDDKDGRTIAGNIRIDQDSIQQIPGCRGPLDWFDDKRRFGQIRDDENRPVFIHIEQVLRNAAGHRCFISKPGTEVVFTLNEYVDRAENKFFATDVRLAEDDSAADNPEYSRVVRWSRDQQHGTVTRSCGTCKLPFRADSVITEGLECIRIGDWIQHTLSTDGKSIFASNVRLFEPGFVPPEPEPVYEAGSAEEFFAALPDLAPVVTIEPGEVYSPTDRKRTLRELIAFSKKSAA